MKRLILVCLAIMCLIPVYGLADFDYGIREYEVSEADLTALAARDFPEWSVMETSRYWSGQWNDQLACYQEIQLCRTEENTLLQMRLSVLVNPLKQGEEVP